MSSKKMIKSALFVGGLALSSATFAAPSGEMLANTCAGCHGTGGVSQGPASPTIAGMSEDYFVDTMQAYRDGTRPSTIMTRIAKGYSDEDIKRMAEYFSKQEFVAQKQEFDTTKAKKGYILHEKSCEKCHEEGGRSAADDAGILAGQWSTYLRYTMADFINGHREMPKKMRKRIEAVNARGGDEAFEYLVNYYASQVKR